MTSPAGAGTGSLLRGIDRAAFAVSFAVRLRKAGVPVGQTGVEDFTRALVAIPPDSLSRLYWSARVSLVRRRGELAAFDAVFDAVFDEAALHLDPHARRKPNAGADGVNDAHVRVPTAGGETAPGEGLPWATLPRVVGTAEHSDSDDDELAVPQLSASALERLAEAPFEDLDELQISQLGGWLADELRHWPTRRSRRRAPGPAGRTLALRDTLARARRTGWDPVELVRVAPVRVPRRVVMLCDVSQSMQAQVPAYFQLMRALALLPGGEGFAFATDLTRLTPVLRHRSAVVAVEQASERVADRFGGTRIAACVTELLSSHHGNAVRGGIVVIASDGWDSEPPAELARAMARLRRRAHRVVWVNPRASAPGFAPLVGTMAAALPYVDALLPADNFAALAHVVRELCTTVRSDGFLPPVRTSPAGEPSRHLAPLRR